MKLKIALELRRLFLGMSLEGLSSSDKHLIFDVTRALRPISEEWDKTEKESIEKVEKKEVTVEEHNAYFNKCMEENIELKIPGKISREAFDKLLEANQKWPAGAFMLIEDNLVETK